jgi:hypothetical protein
VYSHSKSWQYFSDVICVWLLYKIELENPSSPAVLWKKVVITDSCKAARYITPSNTVNERKSLLSEFLDEVENWEEMGHWNSSRGTWLFFIPKQSILLSSLSVLWHLFLHTDVPMSLHTQQCTLLQNDQWQGHYKTACRVWGSHIGGSLRFHFSVKGQRKQETSMRQVANRATLLVLYPRRQNSTYKISVEFMLLRNVGWFSAGCTAVYPKR